MSNSWCLFVIILATTICDRGHGKSVVSFICKFLGNTLHPHLMYSSRARASRAEDVACLAITWALVVAVVVAVTESPL